ncbi:MAG: KH domain-containing protein [Myxococcota bacterium]
MTGLLELIAKALVDKPEQVEVRVSPADGGRVLELKVAPEDVGKVIGRDGRTVNAMRTLLAHLAQRKGEKVRLEILDDRRNAVPAAAPSPSAPPDAG